MATDDPYDPDQAYEALTAAVASDDDLRIARVANEYAWTLATHHYELLAEALEKLPDDVLDQFELLKFAHPIAALLARMHPQPLEERGKIDLLTLDERQMNEYLVKQMIARRLNGDVKSSAEFAARLDERLTSSTRVTTLSGHHPIAQFRCQIGVSYLLDGQTDNALKSLALARQLASLSPDDPVQRDAVVRSAVVHALRGSVRQAERELRLSRRLPEPPPFFAPYVKTAERVAVALIDVDHLGPEAAESVMALESYEEIDDLWPLIALVRSRFELALGHPVAAMEEISHAFGSHVWKSDTLADDVRISCTATAFLALGEVFSARKVCEEGNGKLPLARLAMIRVFLHEGRIADAGRACSQLSGARNIEPATRAEAMVLRAWTTFETDGAISASEALAIAGIALTGDFRRLFSSIPRSLIAAMYAQLPDDVRELVAKALEGLVHAAPLPERPRLSPGEMRVLDELASTDTTEEIAKRLFVTPNTVKTQLAAIYRKLGVRNRADAVAAAARMNLIQDDEAALLIKAK